MNALPLWADVLVALLLLVGAGFALVGSWGLAKLSDFFKRLHGPSKASTAGVSCVLAGSALYFAAGGGGSGHELLVALFLFITAPVAAQLLTQAALRLGSGERPPVPSQDQP